MVYERINLRVVFYSFFVFKKSKAFIDFQMVIIIETYIDKKQPSVLLFYISHQKYQIRYKNQRPAEYTSIRDNIPTKIVRKKSTHSTPPPHLR